MRGSSPLIFIGRSERMEIQALKEAVNQFLLGIHFELYDLKIVKENKQKVLKIFIDKPEGVGMDDVVEATKALNPFIDELDPIPGEYMMEVSSPGAERELRSDKAIEHAVGRLVHVKTYSQELVGDLVAFQADMLTIKVRNKKISVNTMDVQEIRLAIDFRRKK